VRHLHCQLKAILLSGALSVGLLALVSSPHMTLARGLQDKKEQVDEKTIRELIQQLGDDAFTKREEAAQKLNTIGEPAVNLLQKAAKDSADAEIRQRAKQLIESIGSKFFYVVTTVQASRNLGPWVTRVVLTPDGKKMIAAGRGSPCIWEVETGQMLEPLGGGKTSDCLALAISPDGNRVLVGCDGKAAHLFDLRKPGKRTAGLMGHTAEVRGAALLADGKTALTAGWDKTIRVWNLDTAKEIRRFEAVTDKVSCLAVSADGKTVAAGLFADTGGPGTVRLWNLEQGTEIRSMAGHTKQITNVAFSPDGKSLLSSSYDATVRIWDIATGKELKRFGGDVGKLENAAFTADGKQMVTSGGDEDASLRLWDVESGRQIYQSENLGSAVTGLAVLPDGRRCVSCGKDGKIRVWEWRK
jgi:WD40 repeat protein